MTTKKPLNEGSVRGIEKGGVVNQQNKPPKRPTAPPPAPKPPANKSPSR